MTLHLAEIATQSAPGAHLAMLVDQAGWHMSNRHCATQHDDHAATAQTPAAQPVENLLQFML